MKVGEDLVLVDDMCELHQGKLVEVRIREIKEQTQEATLMSKVQLLEKSIPNL